MVELDARVSKSVSLGDKGSLSLDLDVFNLLNRHIPLHVGQDVGTNNTDMIDDVMYPRTVRLGLRYSF
jgi:outer membrane receptor protein involved in Fe transport